MKCRCKRPSVPRYGAVVPLDGTRIQSRRASISSNCAVILPIRLESTLDISRLIFGGVLDRYPGLKICVAHGGGFIPTYAGRMDHAHRERDDCREIIASPRSSYLRKFYFDTLVFEPDQLAFLIEKYGADHILLGTDYPYDMGEEDPLGLVRRVDKLNADAPAAVCGLNAARLLKLDI